MKTNLPALTAAALMLAAAALPAQTSGTSHPEALDDTITVASPAPAVKPSPYVPSATAAPASALHVRDQEVPSSAPAPIVEAPPSTQPVETAQDPNQDHFTVTDDPNSGVVIDVPSAANQVPASTLLKARLNQEISTQFTEHNARFDAILSVPVERNGMVLIPAGTVLSGQVTHLESGHHIGRGAAIHLQPETLTLPDGTLYNLDAQVIDLILDHHARVTSEGTIVSNDPTPGMETAVGVSTAAGAVTGAVLGGGVGAVVGAGIGAGVSSTVWARQSTTQTLHPGTEIIFSLNRPITLQTATN